MTGRTPVPPARPGILSLALSAVLAAGFVAGAVAAAAPAASGAPRGTASQPSQGSPSQGSPSQGTAAQGTTFSSPRWVAAFGRVEFGSPTFATIDGVRAVVAVTLTGLVEVRNAATGAYLPGWPRRVVIKGAKTTWVDSSPAIAYLDGPRRPPTIIVGAGSLFQRADPANGGLIAFRANGSVRFVFHTKATFPESGPSSAGLDDAVFSTPAIGDITGNGQQDIVFGSYDHYIYALTPAGRLVPGFPVQRADTIWSSPALAEVGHTGRDDIFIGGDASGYRDRAGRPCYGGWVTDYRYSPARHAPELVWERCIGQTVWSSPAVGVINRGPANSGGRLAVVVGTSYYPGYASNPATDEVFAFYASNGGTVPGWPVRTVGPTFGSPVIAPAVKGGPPLVFSTSCARCLAGPSVVSAWSGGGRLIWRNRFDAHSEALGSPAVVNVTGSGPNDVLVGNASGVRILSAATGTFLEDTGAAPLEHGCVTDGTPAVGPVPSSAGGPRSGWLMVFACATERGGRLVSFALPAKPDSAPPWPEWRANPQRTGVPDPAAIARGR
ncbi:MAG: hypothetical protein ACRDZ6_10985 [Acidimicrobiales bacterium]